MNSYFASFVIKRSIDGGGHRELGYGQIIIDSDEKPSMVMSKIIGAASSRYDAEVRQIHITQFNKV